ncbi:hypothetical protein AF72_00750 [Xylella taiwanensis]|uniref:Uncharacterized protein n=1 Tax=Xylella taiwanensis TaxID=1444770 RepID=Z9JMP2_9GAMM|nr:hypothetical protein AB672_11325 [Xylella taiwanensis]EWS79454.1 hypothetical protein AF72_00750 [Xylella taiwanensis]
MVDKVDSMISLLPVLLDLLWHALVLSDTTLLIRVGGGDRTFCGDVVMCDAGIKHWKLILMAYAC